jgi:hypothetical protein
MARLYTTLMVKACSSVRLATHVEAGGVFGAALTAAALRARALLRFLAPFLARAFTSLTRLRCAAALC